MQGDEWLDTNLVSSMSVLTRRCSKWASWRRDMVVWKAESSLKGWILGQNGKMERVAWFSNQPYKVNSSFLCDKWIKTLCNTAMYRYVDFSFSAHSVISLDDPWSFAWMLFWLSYHGLSPLSNILLLYKA